MTNQEELLYLSDLLMQAALWRGTDGTDKRPLELEVEDRIRRLRDGLHASRCKDKVRVYDGGKYHWHDREDCEQVPCERSRTGYKWKLKYINSSGFAVNEVDDGPK